MGCTEWPLLAKSLILDLPNGYWEARSLYKVSGRILTCDPVSILNLTSFLFRPYLILINAWSCSKLLLRLSTLKSESDSWRSCSHKLTRLTQLMSLALCTVIHVSMVNVVHRSGLANTGKVVPFVAIATSLALHWTGISRRVLLPARVALLVLCWRILHFGRIRLLRTGIHLWLSSLSPSALVGRRVCSRSWLGDGLHMRRWLSHKFNMFLGILIRLS